MGLTKFDILHRKLGEGNFRRLAKLTGLQPQHVARVCKGMVGANLSTAETICDAAKVTLNDLRQYRELRQERDGTTPAPQKRQRQQQRRREAAA